MTLKNISFKYSGDPLLSGGTILFDSNVKWVDSVNGSDANDGNGPTHPYKTLSFLLSGALTTGSIIVLMPGFSEVLTTTRTIAESCYIIGCGKNGNKPAAELGFDSTAQLIIAIGAADDVVHIRNLRFKARDDASANPRLLATTASQNLVMEDCWFECEATTETYAFQTTSTAFLKMVNCTIESLAQYNSTTQAPANPGMLLTSPQLEYVENMTILGGEGSWSSDVLSRGGGSGNGHWERCNFGPWADTTIQPGAGWIHGSLTGWANLSTPSHRYHYAPGKGGVLGPEFITSGRTRTLKNVLYVSSVLGDDTNYDGTQRQRPYATLTKALGVANADGGGYIIVLAADHDETITVSSTVGEDITIVGEGLDANGEPTAKIGFNGSGAQLLCSNDFIYLWNIRFGANQQANSSNRVHFSVSGDVGWYVRDCVFECDQYDTVAGLRMTSILPAYANLRNVIFRSVQTDPALAPVTAFLCDTDLDGLFMDDVTFDGGKSGFTQEAFYLNGAEHVLSVNMRLLNGADGKVVQDQAVADIILHFAENSESTYVYWEALGG